MQRLGLRLPVLAIGALCALGTMAVAAEVVHFESAVLPPSPLKVRQAKALGKEIVQEPGFPIWGHLSKPRGGGPFPALVLLHGCSGYFPSDARWASKLVNLGYVTLQVDSLGPRSVFDICNEPMTAAPPDTRALDAHGALTYLKALPFIDQSRIGIIGWSHGGTSALAAINNLSVASRLDGRFRAAIAFYPFCYGEAEFDRPTLILLGDADAWAPVEQCQEIASQRQSNRSFVQLVSYPDVVHAFDVEELATESKREGPEGAMFKLKFDRDAFIDAVARVEHFLEMNLK